MKKKIFTLICLFLFCVSFFGCSTNVDNSSSDSSINKSSSDSSINETQTPILVTKQLSKYNCLEYLNINVVQLTQIPTLYQNIYYCEYSYNAYSTYWDYYYGLTPPTNAIRSILVGSKYSVTTTFQIQAKSKEEKYFYSNNTNFTVSYIGSGQQYLSTIYIDKSGEGVSTFMISEIIGSPSKSYKLKLESLICNFEGEVSYYEN